MSRYTFSISNIIIIISQSKTFYCHGFHAGVCSNVNYIPFNLKTKTISIYVNRMLRIVIQLDVIGLGQMSLLIEPSLKKYIHRIQLLLLIKQTIFYLKKLVWNLLIVSTYSKPEVSGLSQSKTFYCHGFHASVCSNVNYPLI